MRSDFGSKKGFTIPGRHTIHGDDERPGPGQYNFGKYLDKNDWGHGVKLPKAAKREQKPVTDVGPGGYEIKDKHDGGFSFGKGKRQHENDPSVPGPGQYQMKPVAPLTSGNTFNRQKRRVGLNDEDTGAGPGAYEIKDKYGGGFKFGRDKREHEKDDGIPGPGNYKEKKVDPLSNLGSFGRQKRRIGSQNDGSVTAGPGGYSPQVDNWCGGYSIGKEKRKGLASSIETPGVGAYTFKDDNRRGGYSFKRSKMDQKPDTTPGFYRPMYSVPDVPKYLLPPEPQRKIHM